MVHALQTLCCLAASTSSIGVAAVARATGISTGTYFNILRTLTRTRFASFDLASKTYRLGLAMAEMAAGLVRGPGRPRAQPTVLPSRSSCPPPPRPRR